MRSLSNELAGHIERGATTLCRVWTLTRADGFVLGFTDHDRDILVGEVNFAAMTGMGGGDTDSSLGYAIDNGHVESIFSSDRLSADDINAGLYDGALLEAAIVNWQDTAQLLAISRGYLGQITQSGDKFTAEWTGEGARLDRSQGRVFSRLCDADFGDARCGLNAANYAPDTICPRSFSACKNRFDNTQNFRGFPYLLGDDALIAAPLESDIRDGGSRYSEVI